MEVLREFLRGRSYVRALDVGCADGILATLGLSNAIGIDIFSGRGVNAYASAEHLPFRENTFDLVFAGEVIEHLRNPKIALQDWVRVLVPSGVLVISTPNGILVGLEGNSPQHQSVLAPSELKHSMSKLGLQVTRTKGIYTGLVSGKRIFRWVPFDSVKQALLRFPVPLSLAYNTVFRAEKNQ